MSKSKLLFFGISLLLFSCVRNSDDLQSQNQSTLITASDFTKFIDENPANNFNIGTVTASSALPLKYIISSQSPTNSLSIDQTTGMLSVLDHTKFDYEINPTINAIVMISNSSTAKNINVTIKLNDLPEITNKWFLDKQFYNSVNQLLTSCEKQGYIKFNSNGTFERKDYYLSGTTCTIEGNDVGNYTYQPASSKITLSFNDINNGPQIEVLNNVQITATTLKYSWDEDGNGTDEYLLEFKK